MLPPLFRVLFSTQAVRGALKSRCLGLIPIYCDVVSDSDVQSRLTTSDLVSPRTSWKFYRERRFLGPALDVLICGFGEEPRTLRFQELPGHFWSQPDQSTREGPVWSFRPLGSCSLLGVSPFTPRGGASLHGGLGRGHQLCSGEGWVALSCACLCPCVPPAGPF